MCTDAGLLGSIDANRGDPQNGWDTDQFSTDIYDAIHAMLVVLEDGGLKGGGLNFDAKVRRESIELEDIFVGHIGGMDTFARALEVASTIREKSKLLPYKQQRYHSFDDGEGARFEKGELDLVVLRDLAEQRGEPEPISGKQEWCENVVNQFL
jgi:xylose isomerase